MSAQRHPGEITRLLAEHRSGNNEAFDRVVSLVYDELMVIARKQLARWRSGGALETAGLVHEAYLRLVDQPLIELDGREHFYAIAARSMRLILVEQARAEGAAKRGGGKRPLPLDDARVALDHEVETMLMVDSALQRLSEVSERLARVFECRFFGGLTEKETAIALGLSERTVQRDSMKARAWLRRELGPR